MCFRWRDNHRLLDNGVSVVISLFSFLWVWEVDLGFTGFFVTRLKTVLLSAVLNILLDSMAAAASSSSSDSSSATLASSSETYNATALMSNSRLLLFCFLSGDYRFHHVSKVTAS